MISAPFDTLQLARRFEAAGFERQQAGDMAAAIASSMVDASLKRKQAFWKTFKALAMILLAAAGISAAGGLAWIFWLSITWVR